MSRGVQIGVVTLPSPVPPEDLAARHLHAAVPRQVALKHGSA